MTVSPDVARLAKLYMLRRSQSEARLSLEGYDRWGRGSTYANYDEDVALAGQAPRTEAEIQALTRRLREQAPDALAYFVDAQQQLLRHFIVSAPDTSHGRTGRSVAQDELAAWEAVLRGEKDRVRQNSHYVRVDPQLFEALFGIPPA